MTQGKLYAATEEVILARDQKNWFRGFVVGAGFGVAFMVILYEGFPLW